MSIKRYEVEYCLSRRGNLEVTAGTRDEARELVQAMALGDLEDGCYVHEVEIDSVTMLGAVDDER